MTHHEEPELIEFRCHIRAWGRERFQDLMDDVANQMIAAEFKSIQEGGVRVGLDPNGGGGPYQTVVQEEWVLRTDGVGLKGYPGYPVNEPDD